MMSFTTVSTKLQNYNAFCLTYRFIMLYPRVFFNEVILNTYLNEFIIYFESITFFFRIHLLKNRYIFKYFMAYNSI